MPPAIGTVYADRLIADDFLVAAVVTYVLTLLSCGVARSHSAGLAAGAARRGLGMICAGAGYPRLLLALSNCLLDAILAEGR